MVKTIDWNEPNRAESDADFWKCWLNQGERALGMTGILVVQPGGKNGVPRVLLRWKTSIETFPERLLQAVLEGDEPFVNEMMEEGNGCFALRIPWEVGSRPELVILGHYLVRESEGMAEEIWRDRVLLWGSSLSRRRIHREIGLQQRRAEALAGALELVQLIRQQDTFASAALELSNQLTTRHQADRVAMGWWKAPYIRLRAASHLNKIEAQMRAVSELEAAMEEAVEEDGIIIWPVPEANPGESGELNGHDNGVTMQHAALARSQGWKHVCSVPLKDRGEIIGMVTWHREAKAFSLEEAERFALVLDTVSPYLRIMERREGHLLKRSKRVVEEWIERHANVRNPWWKLGAIVCSLGLAASLLVKVPYRVEAEFRVRPEEQIIFSAPFDGFLEEVSIRAGDFVAEGESLFSLDATAFSLEEGEQIADLSRFEREREQAEAKGELAAMRIAEAQSEQVLARLKRIKRQKAQTNIKAPFAGYVLDDGDLHERLGAPLAQGDALVRFAPMDGLYFELSVPEADAPLLEVGGPVEMAFRGRPDAIETGVIVRIEPEAVAEATGAKFLLRAEASGERQNWWRPGMTGIAKLETEKRSLADIFTRRLRDWLHLKLWW